MARRLTPTTFEEAAAGLAGAAAARQSVRIVGAGTKQRWGRPAHAADAEIDAGRRRILAVYQRDRHEAKATLKEASWTAAAVRIRAS